GRLACIYSKDGLDYLAVVDTSSKNVHVLKVPYTTMGYIESNGTDTLYLVGASPLKAPEVVTVEVGRERTQTLKRSLDVPIDPEHFSEPEPIEFPTSNGTTAFALFYPPKNKDFTGPTDERPPLIVFSHGGPTGATTSALRLAVQYWTTRGFGIVDVNYGGSTGYGRPFRERLKGNWGIVDVEDCINAARYLERRGDV